MNIKNLPLISACIASMFAVTANAQVTIVDDNFTANGTAGADASWFASSTSSAIEFNANSVGLVSGSSGRQIHAIFPTQTLAAEGDKVTAVVTFTTPATVAATNEDLRVGLFDHLERAGLFQNTSYSSSTPNPDYSGLPGYYNEIDVESTDTATDMDIRLADPSTTGRHISTSSGFSSLGSGPDLGYSILANTTYTFTMIHERLPADELSITVQLEGSAAGLTDSLTKVIPADDAFFNVGMLAMGSSSGAFGSVNSTNTPDNGIDINSFSVVSEIAGGGGPVNPPAAEETCYTLPTTTGGAAVFCL